MSSWPISKCFLITVSWTFMSFEIWCFESQGSLFLSLKNFTNKLVKALRKGIAIRFDLIGPKMAETWHFVINDLVTNLPNSFLRPLTFFELPRSLLTGEEGIPRAKHKGLVSPPTFPGKEADQLAAREVGGVNKNQFAGAGASRQPTPARIMHLGTTPNQINNIKQLPAEKCMKCIVPCASPSVSLPPRSVNFEGVRDSFLYS